MQTAEGWGKQGMEPQDAAGTTRGDAGGMAGMRAGAPHAPGPRGWLQEEVRGMKEELSGLKQALGEVRLEEPGVEVELSC